MVVVVVFVKIQLGPKNILSKNNPCQKIVWPKSVGSKKIWVKKNRSQKFFVKKIKVQKYFGPKL